MRFIQGYKRGIVDKKAAFLIFIFGFLSLSVYSQNMAIASFEMDETDQTANVSPTMKMDINGEKSALIKIVTTQKNFGFDVGSLGVTATEWQNSEHPGEIWLYVPNGVMKISIQHPQFGSIKDYDLGSRLQKGRTYVMVLTSDQVNTLVVDYDNFQILDVNITPHDAELYINGIKQNLDKGRTSVRLPFGIHTWRVTAANYHMQEGKITINDKERQELQIQLKPAFGYLTLEAAGEMVGAEVWLDDIRIGTVPMQSHPVASGKHTLRVKQKYYSLWQKTITVTDEAPLRFSFTPTQFSPDYASAELSVDDRNVQIYDNDELLSASGGRWSGRLETGTHRLEVRKPNHTPSVRTVTVSNGQKLTYTLDTPRPILGKLNITTSPNGAEVIIDGKNFGTTPVVDRELIIGAHRIELRHPGCRPETREIVLQEGKTHIENIRLIDYCSAVLNTTPTGATVTIDGRYAGETPYQFNLEAGQYKIELSKSQYRKYAKTLKLDGNTQDINIKLRHDYVSGNKMYIQAGYNFFPFSGISFGAGIYINNINVEANYIQGIVKSEMVYWYDTRDDGFYKFAATYCPVGFNLKFGYGVHMGGRVCFTPQVGGQMFLMLENNQTNIIIAEGISKTSITFGARLSVNITSKLGISLTPDYLLHVHTSKGYRLLSDISPRIKNFARPFGCNVSVNLFF
ncbi:MAG: PEGA domain-containing protein [Coprobacter sp.]|nr:PEGA domain-containing protein [Coprobacter sp.]